MSELQMEQNLLIFRSGKRYFSLPAEMVDEIAPVSNVTHLPFLEDYIDGLVSLNGQVAVQLNFSVFIGDVDEKKEKNIGELLQISNDSGLYAVRVDEVCENIYIETSRISLFTKGSVEEHDDQQVSIVEGEFDWQGKTVMHIAGNPLSEILNVVNVPGKQRTVLPKRKQKEQKLELLYRYLILTLADEQFAFPLEEVLEIFEAEQITQLPGVCPEILGITIIREQAVLVLSASALLKLSGQEERRNESLLILFEYEGSRVALAFDEVVGIEDIARDQLKLNGVNKKRGVLLSSAKVLVNLLDFGAIVDDSLKKELLRNMPEAEGERQAVKKETGTFLQFQNMNEKYIIHSDSVTRILEYSEPEYLDDKFQKEGQRAIKGVTHFEGEVLPVLDLALQNQSSHSTAYSAYLVIKGNHQSFAVPVIEAERIFELNLENIDRYVNEERDIISGLAKHEGQLLSLLDVSGLEAAYFGGRAS